MKCANCGERLSLFSRFCENCGCKGPSFKEWHRWIWQTLVAVLKKRKWLTAVIASLLLFSVVAGTWWEISHRLQFSDYIITEVTGFNEYGQLSVKVDTDALVEKILGKEPEPTSKRKYAKQQEYLTKAESIRSGIRAYADRTEDLKNGDYFTVKVTVSNPNVFEDLGYSVSKKSLETVFCIGSDTEKLEAPAEYDLLSRLEISFSGRDGNGRIAFSDEAKEIILQQPSGGERKAELRINESIFGVSVSINFPDEEERVEVDLTVDKSSDLSNGDSITLGIEDSDVEKLKRHGISLTVLQMTCEVSELSQE